MKSWKTSRTKRKARSVTTSSHCLHGSSRSAAVLYVPSGNLKPITQFSSPWHSHNTGWVNPCPNERWAGGNYDRVQWLDCSRNPVRFVSPAAHRISCLPVQTRTGMKNCGDILNYKDRSGNNPVCLFISSFNDKGSKLTVLPSHSFSTQPPS